MIFKHYFSFEEIQKMSYFDFTFYSNLVNNVQKEYNEAIKKAREEAQSKS